MYRFWESIIQPIFEIATPKSIVEIGALKGNCTIKLLSYCKEHNARLDCIDPHPLFDDTLWKKEFGDQFMMHKDISLNVLPTLKGYDAVLIDGDHNWYTVSQELLHIERSAQSTGTFPMVFFHDVGWPYGRRDLYCEPDRIPDAYRQAYRKGGMLPHIDALCAEHGMNSNLCNALHENTKNNGVKTAIEDFLGKTKHKLRFISIEGLHGIGILIPENLFTLHAGLEAHCKELQIGKQLSLHIDNIEGDRVENLLFKEVYKKELQNLQTKFEGEKKESQMQQKYIVDLEEKLQSTGHLLTAMRQDHAEVHRDNMHIRSTRSWRWTALLRTVKIPRPSLLLDKMVYCAIAALKDLWTDFDEPVPYLAKYIRNTVLGKRWPFKPESNHTHPHPKYRMRVTDIPEEHISDTAVQDTSENGEIEYLLHLIDEGTPKTVVEIGSSDGAWYSMSLPWIQKGWKAVCVEPHPRLFEKLSTLHKEHTNVTCFNESCSDFCGSGKWFIGRCMNNILSTLSSNTELWKQSELSGDYFWVSTRTLTDMLGRVSIPEGIGILSIDTKGMDYEVLKGLDFSTYRPEVIITEETSILPQKTQLKHVLLKKNGYSLIGNLGSNTIWVPRENFQKLAQFKTVTIVVPAYNNWELLEACIQSLQQYVAPHHRIVIMDDASPEEGFAEHIKNAIADMPNAEYVRNTENLGFVQTCNTAVDMDTTTNDILLLNSDAALTEGCLEEMLTCLYASERHGVCCPRSNAATIFSIGRKNSEPAEAYACWQHTKHLLSRFTKVPTGMAYCMLIRRDLIKKFTLFDTIYGKGYNEENDFCMRIGRHGYNVVAANHAFAFHRDDSPSFSSTGRTALEKKHSKILLERYPEYQKLIANEQWEISGAEQFIWELSKTKKPAIAIDISHLPAAWNGTSLYVLHILPGLITRLSEHASVTIITNKQADLFFGFSKMGKVYIPDLVHTEKTFDLVFVPHQIYSIAHLAFINRISPRWIVTIHDVIAQRCTSLQDADRDMCTRLTLQLSQSTITVTNAARRDIQSYMAKEPLPNIHVVHHGYSEISEDVDTTRTPTKKPFILVIGNHFDHKVIKETMAHLPDTYHFNVIGGKHHAKLAKENTTVYVSGTLDEAKMQQLYAQCSAVIFPSQYEGFGLPLLNAARYGKPILAFDTESTREVESVYGIQGIHYIQSFTDIAHGIDTALALRPSPPKMTRTWDTVANETADILLDALESTLDIHALNRRFTIISGIERLNQKSITKRSLTLRMIKKVVGKALTPFPWIKTPVHIWAHSKRLT